MYRNEFELAYRHSTVSGASPIGLVIALYDTLSKDFRKAAAAIREDNIEKRCSALNHAAVVLGHLENWIDHSTGGELANNLATFYAYLRTRMLEASIQRSAPMLEAQISLISQVRSAWQQKDGENPRMAELTPSMSGFAYATAPDQIAFSRSA